MGDQFPLILSVKKFERSGTSPEGWPLLLCEVETQSGCHTLQLTTNAAHDLKALLKDIGPRMSPGSSSGQI